MSFSCDASFLAFYETDRKEDFSLVCLFRLASLQSFRIFGQIISETPVCYHEDAFYIDIGLCINILENSYLGDNLS